jgi:formylglycine-generating enzyme
VVTVSGFSLDKYEITVGRFRAFVNAGMGTQSNPPASGGGAHPIIENSGWDPGWNTNLPADTAALKAALACGSMNALPTWTDEASANENRPQNCLDWYLAFAFCAWDGGRLPTEAEWNYVAAGGNEQRTYPWGTGVDYTKASYACMGDGSGTCALTDLIAVGTRPAGNGKWDHADLAGNVLEWNLDLYTYPPTACSCADCAVVASSETQRTLRGGDYYETNGSYLNNCGPYMAAPGMRWDLFGARCARTNPQ